MFREAKKNSNKSVDVNKIEVREDEEQIAKFGEIIEMLVDAGYYRARIKGLTSFDKIVGGMTWCIESCSFGVDVDLLFQENLTIGQKIALTEKIVAMLPKMDCPYRIEPHQIQGLDCIHIHPVIKWLVNQSMKTRKEMAQYVHRFAIDQFHRKFEYNSSTTRKLNNSSSIKHISSIKKTYEPRRSFLQKNIIPRDEFSIISNTLLEYGEVMRIPQKVIDKLQEGKSNSSLEDREITKEMIAQKIQEKKKVEELMKNLSELDYESNALSTNLVAKIVNIHAKEVANVIVQFSSSSPYESQDEKPSIKVLMEQNLVLKNQIEKIDQNKQELSKEKNILKSHLYETRNKKQESIKKVNNIQSCENKVSLRQLKDMLIVQNGLKDQENKFRERCGIDLTTFNKLVEDIEKGQPLKKENCVSNHENEKEIINRLRLQLAKKSRLIATITRQLDDVPGRSELFQYQRRFLELYNQVATKHKETKQYYTLYNTLDDTKMYLNKELSLINSIQDNYNEALTSNNSKEQFLKQFESILEGVQNNKIKIKKRCAEEKHRRDLHCRQLITLMEQQRKYVAAVRQLTIECRENEYLLAQLRGP